MSTSLVLTGLIVLSNFPQGQGESSSFVIGDRKFDHVWHTKQNMPDKRSDMTATTVGDAIYLVGGCALDQVWVHDPPYSGYQCGGGAANAITVSTVRYLPKTNTFDTTLPDAPRPRYRHAAGVVDNRIYLLGGTDGSGSIVSEVDVLNTVTGKWTTLTQRMPNPTTDLSAFVHAGKVYTLGGYDASWKASNVTQIFNPTANDINLSWQVGPPLLRGRGDAFAAIVDNKAFAVGGFHDENNFASPIGHMEMLDVARGASWVSKKAMNVSRGDKAVAALNNVLHVIGGETKNSQEHSVPLRDVEVYDPTSNTWYFGGDIPSDRFRFVAAAHGSSIFIFGGQGYLTGGTHGADGSKYALMDTVEEYSERVSPAQVSRTIGLHGPNPCVLLAVLIPVKVAMLWLQDQR